MTQFIDRPPDVVLHELTSDLRELGSRVNPVTGRAQALKAQFYVVELHDMTLKAALGKFPVRHRGGFPRLIVLSRSSA